MPEKVTSNECHKRDRRTSGGKCVSLGRRIYHLPQKSLSRFFYQLGIIVAGRPWSFIILPFIVALVLSTGILWVQLETLKDVWKLYYPQDKPMALSAENLRHTFVPTGNNSQLFCPHQQIDAGISLAVLALSTNSGTSHGKLKGAHALRSLCQFVRNFSLQTDFGETLGYGKVCTQRAGKCVEPIICTSLRSSGGTSIKIDPMFRRSVLPDTATFKPDSNEVLQSPAFRLFWHFRGSGSQESDDSSSSVLFVRALFERLYQMKDKLGRSEGVTFDLYSQIIQSDEMRSIVKNDSKLMAITVVLMSIFSIAVSTNKEQGVLKSRALLAMAGVLNTCLAIGSAVGVLSFIGVKFIQCAFLAPFIMLGIGIDSTFVIMFTWAKECAKSDTFIARVQGRSEIIGNTMEHSFIAVFISNLTALLAFLVGSFTPYEAVNITCYYLAMTTVFLLLYQSTFLIGCLTIHHKLAVREGEKQPRVVLQVQGGGIQTNPNFNLAQQNPENGPAQIPAINCGYNQLKISENGVKESKIVDGTDENAKKASEEKSTKFVTSDLSGVEIDKQTSNFDTLPESDPSLPPTEMFNRLERFICNTLHRIVLNNYVRIVIIFCVGLASGVSINKVLSMRQYINEMGYQPDDSRIIQYYEKSQLYFPVDPMMVDFVIEKPIPYHLNKTRRQLDSLFDQITQTPLALRPTSRLKPWFQAMPFQDYQSPESFVKDLKWRFGIPKLSLGSLGFLEYMQALENECFKNDVIIKHDVILQSRFVVPFEKLESGSFEDGNILVRRLRNITDSFPYEIYFTSLQLMLLERNSLMRKSIWSSIFIAISSCSLVALLLLPDPIVFVAVVATLALTMATTIGFMGILGMHYNIATYIIVLLSIGLCIDYISHSGHAYLWASYQLAAMEEKEKIQEEEINSATSHKDTTLCPEGIPREKIVETAMRNIGVPLSNAALSSILSVSMLGFSSSLVMRNMFKSMMLLFTLSFFYGVIFLPIILSFIGPRPPINRKQPFLKKQNCSNKKTTVQSKLNPSLSAEPDLTNNELSNQDHQC